MMDAVTPFLYDDSVPGDVLAACARGRSLGWFWQPVCSCRMMCRCCPCMMGLCLASDMEDEPCRVGANTSSLDSWTVLGRKYPSLPLS